MLVEILVELNDVRQRYYVGTFYDVDDGQARRWVESGWARLVVANGHPPAPDPPASAGPPKRPRGRPRKAPVL